MNFNQFRNATAGDTIATFKIKDFGDIKVLLFPEIAPKTVENFTTHAKNGYYNNTTFHRVIKDFMIQGGDPKGNGTGGESIWGEAFDDEFSKDAFPYDGALCMANRGPNTNGSQFFIVELSNPDKDFIEQMIDADYPTDIIDNYKEHAGTPWLFLHHTVFGQVIDGQDVVRLIARTPLGNPMTNKPKEPVIVETIEIETL